GSPSFEIPRSVQRDIELSRSEDGKERARKLAAKNKHNLVTMGLFLLAQWVLSFLMVLLFFGAIIISCIQAPRWLRDHLSISTNEVPLLYETVRVSIFVLALMLAQFVRTSYHVLVERASTLFQALQPQECSIHDPYFWYHERFWKLGVLPGYLAMFDGTPF